MSNAPQLVQKLWNCCKILRDDGLSYGDYVEQERIVAEVERRLSVVEELSALATAKRNNEKPLNGMRPSSATTAPRLGRTRRRRELDHAVAFWHI
jgi:hypothetical protein